jgi:hypothetical protein
MGQNQNNLMAFSFQQCQRINNILFRRTPNFDKRLVKDRFPQDYTYSNMYQQEKWPSGTGTQHVRDRVHVTDPNDDGCWDIVSIGGTGSATGCDALCSPGRKVVGFGSTRYTYEKAHRDYMTPPMCFDQMRDVEEIAEQLAARMEGLKELPDAIVSGYLRLRSLQLADVIHICGADTLTVPVTSGMFTNNCTRINLGGTGNLPTSKLTLQYLDNHAEDLLYNGYFRKDFMPQGLYAITTDFQTHRDLCQQNPSLSSMWALPDFDKGGKFFEYGMMQKAVGNWKFKLDPEPMRFQHVGGGVLERVRAYENVATTVGKRKEFSQAYKNAPYQLYHVFNRNASTVFVGDITPVHPELKFNMARSLLGQWSWKSPHYFTFTDPNNGTTCAYQNDKGNYGYLLGEFELGMVTDYPEIEMWILALREPQGIVNLPRSAAVPSVVTQSLAPYNSGLCAGDDED